MDTSMFRDTLIAKEAELKRQLDTLGSLDHTVLGDWVAGSETTLTAEADVNLVADATEEMITRTAELDVLETELAAVTRALEKIEAGAYGHCEICNEPIEEARLRVQPAARTCKIHLNDERDLAQ